MTEKTELVQQEDNGGGFSLNRIFRAISHNATLLRSELLSKLFDPRRDLDIECGYPKEITTDQYRKMYDREAGRRVVGFLPEESWQINPLIFETEDPSETAFEVAWKEVVEQFHIFFHLWRVDVLSGIGRFGVLLLGLDDGLEFIEPVDGFDEQGVVTSPKERKLLYLRAFDEDAVTVDTREDNESNPRFGQPILYSITFKETEATATQRGNVIETKRTIKVHWTRVIHIADNRETSEIFGVPRQQPVWNRLMDLRKVMAGSAEMFYKGAFPGYSVESHPNITLSDSDITSVREQLGNHFNGLQRWMALSGASVKSLAPQVADPTEHADAILKMIALVLGVPWRNFIGSEQAQLASAQDARTWNGRVRRRNENYLTPMVIRPFVDRLIAVGVVVGPSDGYNVEWPDLNTVTDDEKASVAEKITKALALYVSSGVDQIMPPAEYLTMVHGFDPEAVDQIIKASAAFQEELDDDLDVDPTPDPDNVIEEE